MIYESQIMTHLAPRFNIPPFDAVRSFDFDWIKSKSSTMYHLRSPKVIEKMVYEKIYTQYFTQKSLNPITLRHHVNSLWTNKLSVKNIILKKKRFYLYVINIL